MGKIYLGNQTGIQRSLLRRWPHVNRRVSQEEPDRQHTTRQRFLYREGQKRNPSLIWAKSKSLQHSQAGFIDRTLLIFTTRSVPGGHLTTKPSSDDLLWAKPYHTWSIYVNKFQSNMFLTLYDTPLPSQISNLRILNFAIMEIKFWMVWAHIRYHT